MTRKTPLNRPDLKRNASTDLPAFTGGTLPPGRNTPQERPMQETSSSAPCEFVDDWATHGPCGNPKHRAAVAARAAGAPGWSPIVRGQDGGGDRDFLDGKPIHCGSGLELQAIEYRHDDYGEFTIKLPTGTPVRYELAWVWKDGQKREIVLYASIAGHEFTSKCEPWMRFRWPSKR